MELLTAAMKRPPYGQSADQAPHICPPCILFVFVHGANALWVRSQSVGMCTVLISVLPVPCYDVFSVLQRPRADTVPVHHEHSCSRSCSSYKFLPVASATLWTRTAALRATVPRPQLLPLPLILVRASNAPGTEQGVELVSLVPYLAQCTDGNDKETASRPAFAYMSVAWSKPL